MNQSFNDLRLLLLRCALTPHSPIASPSNPAVALRGALGLALFQRNCFQPKVCETVKEKQSTVECHNQDSCLYHKLFAGQEPHYILRSLEPSYTLHFSETLPLVFELIILGKASDHRLAILQAISDARHKLFESSSSLAIESLSSSKTRNPSLIFKDGQAVQIEAFHFLTAKELMAPKPSALYVTLRLDLISPLSLRDKRKKMIRLPSLSDIVFALLSRLKRWANTETFAINGLEFLLSASKEARLSESRLESVKTSRYSKSQNNTQWLGGMIGSMVFENVSSDLIPYLKLAEYLHLGQDTTFGLGKIRLKWWDN